MPIRRGPVFCQSGGVPSLPIRRGPVFANRRRQKEESFWQKDPNQESKVLRQKAMLEVEVHPKPAMDENREGHGPEGRGNRRLAS